MRCSTGSAAVRCLRSAIAPFQDVLQPIQLSVYHDQAAVHRLGAKFCRRDHGDGKLAAVLAIRQDAGGNCPKPALRLDEVEIDHPEHRVGLHAHQSRHRGHGDLPPVSLARGCTYGTRDRPLHQALRVSQEIEHLPGRSVDCNRARQRLHRRRNAPSAAGHTSGCHPPCVGTHIAISESTPFPKGKSMTGGAAGLRVLLSPTAGDHASVVQTPLIISFLTIQ